MRKLSCFEIDPSLLQTVIETMCDPAHVKKGAMGDLSVNQGPFSSQGTSWEDLSLSNGYPSLLLLFGTLCNKGLLDSRFEQVIHTYVLKIKEVIETRGIPSLSLFGGAAGISFALKEASFNGKRYKAMLETLNIYLLGKMDEFYFDPINIQILNSEYYPSFLYDVIQGISGIGRFALENMDDPRFLELAEKIIKILIEVCRPRCIHGKQVPGWHVTADDPIYSNHPKRDLQGNFNLGLAHGVTGILAFLSTAALKGVVIPNHKETIQWISNWLWERSFKDNGFSRWSGSISWEEEVGKTPMKNTGTRDAWCYGVPGIARTLFLAGRALEDEKLKTFSFNAFKGIFQRNVEEWNLPGPMLCHGIAGLLAITDQMSQEQGCEELLCKVSELSHLLSTFYDPQAPFGFQDIEPGTNKINRPGLLEGTAGILLTLYSLSDPHPNWQLPLLIHA